MITALLLIACRPSSPPMPVGTFDDPDVPPPIDRVDGMYPRQHLGIAIKVGPVLEPGREAFIIGSGVEGPGEPAQGYTVTPGETWLVGADGEHRRIAADFEAFGGLLPVVDDWNGDGLHDLLVSDHAHTSLFLSPFASEVTETDVVWRRRILDLDPIHPLAYPALNGRSVGLPGTIVGCKDSAIRAVLVLDPDAPLLTPTETAGFFYGATAVEGGAAVVIGTDDPGQHRLFVLDDLDSPWDTVPSWQLPGVQHFTEVVLDDGRMLVHDTTTPPYALYAVPPPTSPSQAIGEEHLLLRSRPDYPLFLPAAGDLDGDGFEDLIVNIGIRGPGGRLVGIWRGPLDDMPREPDMVFTAFLDLETFPESLATADLDGDGMDELAVGGVRYGPGQVLIYEDILAPWHLANPGYR